MRLLFLLAVILFVSTNVNGQTPCSGTPPQGSISFPSVFTGLDTFLATGYNGISDLTFQWEFSDTGCAGPWQIQTEAYPVMTFSDSLMISNFAAIGIPTFPWNGWMRVLAVCTNTGDSSYSDCVYVPGDTSEVTCFAWFEYLQIGNGSNINFISYPWDPAGIYSWDFGDGNVSVEQNPDHQYANSGNYTVCLTYTDASGNSCSHCNTVSVFSIATLTGLVYSDANQNGQHDSGEPGIPNQPVGTNGFGIAYTDSSGNYAVQVPLGTYTLQFNPFNSNPAAWSLTAPSGGSYVVNANDTVIYSGFDFGVYVYPSYHDVSVEVFCENPVSGFWNYDSYIVKNTGLSTEDVTLVVSYDSVLSYVYAYPVPSIIDQAARTLTYNLQALPGNTYLFVEYQCAIGTPLLTAVYNDVTVTLNGATDVDPSNNTATCQTTVVGSYDPNDKQVNPAGVGANNAVHPDDVDELTYRVRFQNTGTAPAYFITVLDTLDTSVLDVTSFQFLEHSHPCQVQITEGNILRVHFPNIMLPDSFTNEPGSHGHFFFKIKRHQGLANGTVISNKAYIYFDYNEPVITNAAFITLDESLLAHELIVADDYSVYPVPVDKMLSVVYAGNGLVGKHYAITDIMGRTVSAGSFDPSGKTLIDASKFHNGVYCIRVENANGLVVRKFTVLHR